jgi:hypothetical protein
LVVGEVTVAVNFTVCPALEGFTDDTTVVAEVALSTTCFRAGDALFSFAASPP